jgi:hypothetical protein
VFFVSFAGNAQAKNLTKNSESSHKILDIPLSSLDNLPYPNSYAPSERAIPPFAGTKGINTSACFETRCRGSSVVSDQFRLR